MTVSSIEKNAIALAQRYGIGNKVYDTLEQEQAFYVINTSGTSGPAGALYQHRGVLSFTISVSESREVVVKIPNTFAPINLVEYASVKSLQDSSVIRRNIAQGLITAISPEHARALLSQDVIQKEIDRLSNMELKLRAATSVEEDIVLTRATNSTESDSIESLNIKSAKTETNKVSKTQNKIEQVIVQLNEDKDEEGALQTLTKLQIKGKLKDRHYLRLMNAVDRRFKGIRNFAKDGL